MSDHLSARSIVKTTTVPDQNRSPSFLINENVFGDGMAWQSALVTSWKICLCVFLLRPWNTLTATCGVCNKTTSHTLNSAGHRHWVLRCTCTTGCSLKTEDYQPSKRRPGSKKSCALRSGRCEGKTIPTEPKVSLMVGIGPLQYASTGASATILCRSLFLSCSGVCWSILRCSSCLCLGLHLCSYGQYWSLLSCILIIWGIRFMHVPVAFGHGYYEGTCNAVPSWLYWDHPNHWPPSLPSLLQLRFLELLWRASWPLCQEVAQHWSNRQFYNATHPASCSPCFGGMLCWCALEHNPSNKPNPAEACQVGSCVCQLTEARREACPQCTNDCANTRAELLSLRWSFFCGVCCSFCFAGDSSQRLLSTTHPMLQVLEAQCYKITTMKGPAVWYHQTKVCQSGYSHT